MAKLPVVSDKKIIKILFSFGFSCAPKRGKGSHRAFMKIDKNNKKYLVIVPQNKAIPVGTLMCILEQAGITREEFLQAFLKT